MEQVKRIKAMERSLDRALQAVMKLSAALDDYAAAQTDIRKLEKYYGSDEWRQDFTDDEQGRLPQDLKRGVLSEDGIWNVLTDCRDLDQRLREFEREAALPIEGLHQKQEKANAELSDVKFKYKTN